MNLNCDATLDLISLYWDGTLSASTRAAVREHLRGCPTCRNQYQQYAHAAKIAVQRPEPKENINLTDGYNSLLRKLKKQHSMRVGFLAGCACVTLAAVAISVLRDKKERSGY
ncbi:MAG TPA: zf-HC2 domain-containing protein [Oscillospiraceae bacterium]|nr:zf-HC2 domain-containing protein [Oscillospiraceae bacterium]HPF55584.1 zf-HC2 domain-containing protein [Clostridiales bacterium]HPK35819.1 zf-HC2 domain-containing protein [Oscillospiraceae bacterium]HPR76337.1 zf-HC2 domain-containing protein [Oscillospiraceae bacterium]